MRKRRKKKRGFAGNGMGAHQEVSPQARPLQTPNRKDRRRKADRRAKQRGWV